MKYKRYGGPYRVIKMGEKHAKLNINGKSTVVAKDRVIPARAKAEPDDPEHPILVDENITPNVAEEAKDEFEGLRNMVENLAVDAPKVRRSSRPPKHKRFE